MKILFLSYAESHSIKWVNALCDRGHQVYFVIQKNVVNKKADVNKKIKIFELPFEGKKGYILNSYALKKLVKKIDPDVVNVHYASGYGTMARLAGIKKELLSVWGSDVYDFPYKNRFCMYIIKKNLLHAKQIASTSNCMASQVKKIIYDKKKITVTPFGIDIEKFSPERFKEKSDATIVIGNIKVISPKYGIDDLIKAFELLRKDLLSTEGNKYIAQKIRCVIYGPGEQRDELIKMVKDKGLEEYIKFPGEIEANEVPEKLSGIDIFCATSVLDSESFGVSVVEAEAMEIPVVVTDVDGFREVVEDGITGIIVKRRNINEIYMALKKLVLDEELRHKMGKNGRKRVIEKYNFEDNVTIMEKIYFDIAKDKYERNM